MNSRSPAIETAIPGVTFFEEALPGSLFERLARAIRAVGRERIKRNYTTTFWLPLGQKPTNVAEEAALALFGLAVPFSRAPPSLMLLAALVTTVGGNGSSAVHSSVTKARWLP